MHGVEVCRNQLHLLSKQTKFYRKTYKVCICKGEEKSNIFNLELLITDVQYSLHLVKNTNK